MMRGSSSLTNANISSSVVIVSAASTPLLFEQQRFSGRYLSKDFVETRQPQWLSQRMMGISFQEKKIARNNTYERGSVPAPRNSNTWVNDTTPEINPYLKSYQGLHHELNLLLNRGSSLNAVGVTGYTTSLAPFELENDLRYRGADRNMISNLFYEPEWNKMISEAGSQQNQNTFVSIKKIGASQKKVVEASQKLNEGLSEESVEWWWKGLVELLEHHRAAVGSYAPGRARNIRKIQEYFVNFSDAINSFQFQDGYISNYLFSTRPKKDVDDLYGIFLEMEANRIDPNYCARCGQNVHDTAFCGQGDAFTLYRQYRGRPVRHKPWAKEWLEAAAIRAESLWYRAQEDPFFGNAGTAFIDAKVMSTDESPNYYTQKQCEELLRIYCLSKQRAKANQFMVNLMGSREYLLNKVTITDKMQQLYDELLATTPHPHLLTGVNGVQPAAASRYIAGIGGNSNTVPQSPTQLRIDMEVSKIRREQKEEGVVRIPPKDWEIDTKSIVQYKVDPKTGMITNWEDVRASIDKSFLASGLPSTAWMAHELREMKYLEDKLANKVELSKQLDAETEADRELCRKNAGKYKMFPDCDAYRAFDVRPETIGSMFNSQDSAKKFNYGDSVLIRSSVFADPANVPVKIGSASLQLNVTDEMCRMFGDFTVGMKVRCTSAATDNKVTFDGLVLGVDVSGSPSEWNLQVLKLGGAGADRETVSLGSDLHEVRAKYSKIEKLGVGNSIRELDAQRTEREFHNAFIIGVRNDVLYAQLDEGVAVPLGRKDVLNSNRFEIRLRTNNSSILSRENGIQEPKSWNIPFRNDNSSKRLDELKKAPWMREDVAPLIAHGYTPKEKRFGYTQHIKQDDFMTGEYRDRLLSRQYFNNAQKFRVVPDAANSTAANFNGKNSFFKTQGFPSVDRSELENGWVANSGDVPKYEVDSVEQALRDISGTRPGNFIRAPEEVAQTDLEESWWKRANPHWKQKQDDDQFEHPARRRHVDPSSLPFGGEMPLAGSTMGIGDRLKETMSDLSRSFDLGPHGNGPTHNTKSTFNTLDSQTHRSEALSAGDTLRDLFTQKLRADGLDNTSFVVSRHCSNIDPKILIISLNEWMDHGKAPSLVLVRVLQRYLSNEIATYNSSIPDGVQRLSLDALTKDGVVSLALCSTSAWSHRRPHSYRKALAKINQANSRKFNSDSWLMSFYFEQKTTSLPGQDPDLRQNAFESLSEELLSRLRSLIGKNLEEGIMRNHTFGNKKSRSFKDAATTPQQLVRSPEVAKLLVDIGVPSEQRSLFMNSLYEESMRNAQQQEQTPHDFITTINTVLSIESIDRVRTAQAMMNSNSANSGSSSSANNNNNNNFGNSSQQSQGSSVAGSAPLANVAPVVPAVLDRLMLLRDGYAADLLYQARENKKRAGVFEEFCRLAYARPIENIQKLDKLIQEKPDYLTKEHLLDHYNNYCDGKWAPRVNDAVDMITAFIKTSLRSFPGQQQRTNNTYSPSSSSESENPLSFFAKLRTETSSLLYKQGQADYQGQKRVYYDIEMPAVDDLSKYPFEFDNIVSEKRQTITHLAEWTPTRRAGPLHEYVPLLPPTNANAAAAGTDAWTDDSNNNNTQKKENNLPQTFLYGVDPVYFTYQSLHGLDTKIEMIAQSAEDCPSPQLKEELLAFVKDPNSVAKLANRILNRCFPVLKTWNEAVRRLRETERSQSRVIQQNINSLTTLNRAADDKQQETDFRQNAERYWKKVIDTGGVLQTEGGGGGSGGGGQRGGGGYHQRGNNNNNNQNQNQRRNNNSSGNNSASSPGQQMAAAETGGSQQHRKFNVNLSSSSSEGKSTNKHQQQQRQDQFKGLGSRMMSGQQQQQRSQQGGRGSSGAGGRGNYQQQQQQQQRRNPSSSPGIGSSGRGTGGGRGRG